MGDFIAEKIVNYMESNKNILYIKNTFIDISKIQHIQWERVKDPKDPFHPNIYNIKIYMLNNHILIKYYDFNQMKRDLEGLVQKWISKDHPAYIDFLNQT